MLSQLSLRSTGSLSPAGGGLGVVVSPKAKASEAQLQPAAIGNPQSEPPGGIPNPKSSEQRTKLRADFPFLSQPTCPPELKILAANKITAYHNYVASHARLFDCTNLNEQYATVKHLVENFIENRRIFDEFNHYLNHGHCLGKHPVFKELQALKALRSKSVIELVQYKQKLEHNIWRIESELKKKSKPHLTVEREHRLQTKKNELAEVERLLQSYT